MGIYNWIKKMRSRNKINLFIIFIVFNFLVFSGAICRPLGAKPIELVVWGMSDRKLIWDELIRSYEAIIASDKTKPKVDITYVQKSYSTIKEYEDELNKALVEGNKPDIVFLNNYWMPSFKNKIYPLNKGVGTAQDFQKKFVNVVSEDFLGGNNIYAMPLSMDTLALYYNVDLLNNSGIFNPPRTWDEFSNAVIKITKSDETGKIVRAGAAIGTDKNVDRSSDIISLLLMQGGSTITDESRRIATFTDPIEGIDVGTNSGQEKTIGGAAFQFYTDYANPAKNVYTWNPLLDNSIDAFSQNKAAMMINYAYNIPVVREKNPKLRFAIAPVPQYTGVTVPVNYADYWAMTVSIVSAHPQDAWDFLIYLAKPDTNKKYLTQTGKVTAQRDLVVWQEGLQENFDDLNLAVFARQSLTARSWYQKDKLAVENIFKDAINSIVLGRYDSERASITAASQLNQIMKK